MVTRPLAVLILAAALPVSGCTTTRIIPRADVTALAEAGAALRGRNATVNLIRASERGRVSFVQPDSTGWTSGPIRRAVPTSEVYSIVRNTRSASARRGALIGAGVLLGVALFALAVGEEEEEEPCGFNCPWITFDFDVPPGLVVMVFTLSGAGYGAGIGAALGERTEYRFVE